MNFAYYIFLLLIIFLSFLLLKENIKYTPKKIKIYLMVIIIMLILRNITLIGLCVVKSSKYINYLKQIIFLDYIAVPLMIVSITYIYLRSEKLKFTGNYFIAVLLMTLYEVIINISKITIEISVVYGFVIRLENEIYIVMLSLILLGILMILNIIIIDKPHANTKGITCVICAIVIVMIEEVINISGIKLFPYPVFGEVLFLIIMNFVINGFKKISK